MFEEDGISQETVKELREVGLFPPATDCIVCPTPIFFSSFPSFQSCPSILYHLDRIGFLHRIILYLVICFYFSFALRPMARKGGHSSGLRGGHFWGFWGAPSSFDFRPLIWTLLTHASRLPFLGRRKVLIQSCH